MRKAKFIEGDIVMTPDGPGKVMKPNERRCYPENFSAVKLLTFVPFCDSLDASLAYNNKSLKLLQPVEDRNRLKKSDKAIVKIVLSADIAGKCSIAADVIQNVCFNTFESKKYITERASILCLNDYLIQHGIFLKPGPNATRVNVGLQ